MFVSLDVIFTICNLLNLFELLEVLGVKHFQDAEHFNEIAATFLDLSRVRFICKQFQHFSELFY